MYVSLIITVAWALNGLSAGYSSDAPPFSLKEFPGLTRLLTHVEAAMALPVKKGDKNPFNVDNMVDIAKRLVRVDSATRRKTIFARLSPVPVAPESQRKLSKVETVSRKRRRDQKEED
jgi:hypothetical protein